MPAMANNVVHFAIQADDVERAKAFYATVFGWRFDAWGPPGFYNVTTGDAESPGIAGALYGRSKRRTGDDAMIGYRCTIAVDDVRGAEAAVRAAGGTIKEPISTIPGVGTLFEFCDTEGNVVCAMEYDRGH